MRMARPNSNERVSLSLYWRGSRCVAVTRYGWYANGFGSTITLPTSRFFPLLFSGLSVSITG